MASLAASRQATSLRSRFVWPRLLSAKAGDTGIRHLLSKEIARTAHTSAAGWQKQKQ
jgi:hypothetical protein